MKVCSLSFIITRTADLLPDPQVVTNHLPSDLRRTGGFSLQQIDPVEAKCLEIRNLLQEPEPFVDKTVVAAFITRNNLVLCSELYGKHFQPNVPILHMPTFYLIEASPILLLAVMLVGACYAENLVPVSLINKLAMRLLVLIENQLVSVTLVIERHFQFDNLT